MDIIPCVYMIVYNKTGQLYIGETVNFNRRIKQHINSKNNNVNSKIDEFIQNHNIDDFHFFILEILPSDKTILRQKEREYIDLFDAESYFNFNISYHQRHLRKLGIIT